MAVQPQVPVASQASLLHHPEQQSLLTVHVEFWTPHSEVVDAAAAALGAEMETIAGTEAAPTVAAVLSRERLDIVPFNRISG